jgi:hypothetical protein
MSVFVKNFEAKGRNGNVSFSFGGTEMGSGSGEVEEKAYSSRFPSAAATISKLQV